MPRKHSIFAWKVTLMKKRRKRIEEEDDAHDHDDDDDADDENNKDDEGEGNESKERVKEVQDTVAFHLSINLNTLNSISLLLISDGLN